MNKTNDTFNRDELKANPFKMPEGYMEGLADSVRERIAAEEAPKHGFSLVWQSAKPAIALAAMFAVIFGIGYGVLSLTGTARSSEPEEQTAVIEEGYINDSYLMDYIGSDAEEESTLNEEEILSYLESSVSFSDLQEIYAELK